MATKMNAKKVKAMYSTNGTIASSKKCSTTSGKHQKPQKQKKVEVRWLQNEAELYLKQWQRRYHQLEGIEDNYHQLSHHLLANNDLEEYDDWCFTSQRILDMDLDLIDNQKINKNNNNIINNKLINNNSNNDFDIFWKSEPKLIFNFENNSDEADIEDLDQEVDDNDDDLESVENIFLSNSQEKNHFQTFNTFNKHKNTVNDSNNAFYRLNLSNDKDELQKSEDSFAISLNKKLEQLSEESTMKSRLTKSRSKDKSRPRTRPPPIRRQLFKCEHPGCSYQSDRNFNFLRHKRTHRKNKNDSNDMNDSNCDKTDSSINTMSSKDNSINDKQMNGNEKVSDYDISQIISDNNPLDSLLS